MVWLKNPLPYLAQYPDADVLTSSDQVSPTVTDDRLGIWQQDFSIDCIRLQNMLNIIYIAKEWKDMLLADDKMWDQNGFKLVRRLLGLSVDGDSALVYAFDGNLKLGILPASIFCRGHNFFVQIKTNKVSTCCCILLNRTLVIPPLWCKLDRLWFPHPGALEGSITRQPFLCPLEHVFECLL
ncbi:hypothetical protein SLA2020_524070 [Shorea laevis]